MLFGKRFQDMAPGLFLFGARGARPIHEEALATDFATHIADGVGEFAENLHWF